MDTLPDFLQPLEWFDQPFPLEAVAEVIARKEEAIPHLVAALEWTVVHGEEIAREEESFLHLYALYILAQWREPRGYAPAIALARHPAADDLLGDTIASDLPGILACLSEGDTGPIFSLIEDLNASEWARGSGVRALGALHCAGRLSREALASHVGSLFAGGLEKRESNAWNSLGQLCADFGLSEHWDAIVSAFDQGLLDPMFEPLEAMEPRVMGKQPPHKAALGEYAMIDSAVDAMHWWDCFRKRSDAEKQPAPAAREVMNEAGETAGWRRPAPPTVAPEPFRREEPKIGRNNPCPCGSGRKYKKCCGR